jgi:hypothetical protein
MQHLRTKKTSYDTNEQGDQIRRVFINFVIVYTSDSFCANFWSISFSSKNCVSIWAKNGLGYILAKKWIGLHFGKKMDWATFWAIFSQTHPVALQTSSFVCLHRDLIIAVLTVLMETSQAWFSKIAESAWIHCAQIR